jgi:hypothetical protein
MRSYYIKSSLTFIFIALFSLSSFACTIFVLTDSNRTLFFNNEDASNPSTRIWFRPATKGSYGIAYLGFDNYWAQGGLNTKGLAFDWVAGANSSWKPDLSLIQAVGNPSERMLESCANVEEAIAFYKKYRESAFSYAKILIADKTGASVIIGIKDGQLYFDRSSTSRGFGYGAKTLGKLISADTKPSLEIGLPILDACKQNGTNATKYSNVFDLTSAKISVNSYLGQKETIELSLEDELKKGGHYYDLPKIQTQLKQPLLSLPTKPKIIELPRDILEQYVGKYRNGRSSTFFIKIYIKNGRFFYHQTNKAGVFEDELHASSKDLFFFKGIPPLITFIRDEEGKVVEIAVHQGTNVEKFKKVK